MLPLPGASTSSRRPPGRAPPRSSAAARPSATRPRPERSTQAAAPLAADELQDDHRAVIKDVLPT
ncbi:hypothetical protein ACIBG6_25585 [Streptomyces sp. NPDC050842]|uniref:hypothetical protein n=1 Tax=Streptomyces sp. NPDC050842 TaxID=3365636 RepID=UPI003787D747